MNNKNTEISDLINSLDFQKPVIKYQNLNLEIHKYDFAAPKHIEIYDASIIILVQGSKTLLYHGEEIVYDPDNILLLSSAMQFQCTSHLGKDNTISGIKINLDFDSIYKIISQMDTSHFKESNIVETIQCSDEIKNTFIRLLHALQNQQELEILGENLINELIYRIFKNEKAGGLYNLILEKHQYSKLAKTLDYIHANSEKNLSIDELSDMAHMSHTSFFNSFKKITSLSPIQYIKNLRLAKAKELLIYEKYGVKEAAAKVGYKNVSQFSREFKRLFDKSPVDFKV